MRKPSAGALLLGLVPFAAMCFSVPLWDRIYPMLFGIPFNLFWLISWIVLTTICMCSEAKPKRGLRAKQIAHSVTTLD